MVDAARAARFERLYEMLKVLLVQETFTLRQMKERLPHEVPGYVTQLVHQLQREGHLHDSDGVYSWTCELSDFPARPWVEAQVHGTQVPVMPEEDRPRERLLALGPARLKTAELVAILIRAGRKGESALQAGDKIAGRYKDRLHSLADAGRGELKDIAAAIGETAYCQIMAGIELGRRVAESLPRTPTALPASRTPATLFGTVATDLRDRQVTPPRRNFTLSPSTSSFRSSART